MSMLMSGATRSPNYRAWASANLGLLLFLSACGASAGSPATLSGSAASTSASSAAAPSEAPTAAAVTLPPHGDLKYELKFGQGASNMTPTFKNASLDKVRVLDDGIEFSASPKGNAGMNLPDAVTDNFVLAMRLRTVTGSGVHVLAFRRGQGDYPSINLNTNTGTVGLALQTNGAFNKYINPPVLKWPQDATSDVSVVISALGPEIVVYVNGTEAMRSKDTPVPSGTALGFYVNGPNDGDTPFVARLLSLQLYAPEASALAALAEAANAALPPHGDLIYELKPTPPSANITTTTTKAADKVQVLPNGLRLSASPGGVAIASVPGLADNFVLTADVAPVSGAGFYSLAFHVVPGVTLHQLIVSQSAGTLEIDRTALTNPTSSKRVFGPEPRLSPGSKTATSLALSVQGSDIVAYIDGKEAAKANDAGPKGEIRLGVGNAADAKDPFVAELRSLKVYQAAAKPA